jgi:hypothetical protein
MSGGDRELRPQSAEPRSHVGIVRTAPALRRRPVDVGVGVLDVAGFAVNAVLSVYDIFQISSLADPLIDSGGTIARRRTRVDVMLRRLLKIGFTDMQVSGLVLGVIGVRKKNRGKAVEADFPVRLGIIYPLALCGG